MLMFSWLFCGKKSNDFYSEDANKPILCHCPSPNNAHFQISMNAKKLHTTAQEMQIVTTPKVRTSVYVNLATERSRYLMKQFA